jgi:hypothetical protein
MKKIVFLFFFLVSFSTTASHIVGGEFELLHLSGKTYRLRMILYFDKVHGAPGAKDDSVWVRIFRKQNNEVALDDILLLRIKSLDEDVKYSDLECSNDDLKTERLVYEAILELNPSDFTDPEGYYVAWERCCRNYDIKNIYSAEDSDPNFATQYAGQTFYLEFPPLIKNGKRFYNSSPSLFQPLRDYACPDKLYFVDFGGVDDDGDSLAYSLVTPFNTHSAEALPSGNRPRPGPYPSVKWKPGFSSSNMMKGDPPLWISHDGFLRVVPTLPGLFVFAVKCEEYRNGEKIGEVRRDFQMLVVNYCPSSEPPVIVGKTPSSPSYSDALVVSYNADVTDEERCIEVVVSDPDAFSAAENFSETVRIDAVLKGSRANVSGVLPIVRKATLTPGSPEVAFEICFQRCPLTRDGHFKMAIVAYDDACSQPLSDSLWVDVYVEPPPNEDPYFETDDVENVVEVNAQQSWPVKGIDPDNNPVELNVITEGKFELEDFGFSLETTILEPGNYDGIFRWNPDCNVLDFSEQQDFNIKLVLNDLECEVNEPDTMTFDLHLNIPPNTPPELTVSSATELKLVDHTITADVRMPIVLDIVSKDTDIISPHNQITVVLDTAMSELPAGYLFSPATGVNIVQTNFSWTPECDIFTDNNWTREYKFVFRTYDRSCIAHKEDTVSIDATINDIDSKRENFLPPNLITPNGDGYNDYFGLDEIMRVSDTDVLPNLPLDNCAGRFLSIEIFNRWGKKVFESDRRNFRWYANNIASGIYFYTVQYTNANYKGSLNVKF